MAATMNIALQRNEDFSRSFTLEDEAGVPLDLTGCTIAMQVKDRLTNATTIATATVAITNALAGQFDVTLRASEGTPLGTFGDPLHTYNLPYDLRVIYVDGYRTVLTAGVVILSRGKTFA